MNKMNKKGFTLIEMLVVIAIIAVLVSIIVPVVGNSTTKAKAATDAANLRSFAASIAIDYMDNNTIDNTYSAPDCKSETGTLKVYLVNDQVVAVFENNNTAHGVEYYAFIAEHGKTSATVNNATVNAPTATTSNTVLYPVSNTQQPA